MRLIDADRFKNWLMENYVCYDHTIADIDAQPTIDAEPVRHGKWIKVDDDEPIAYDCSECDAMVTRMYNYCPCCGAKMEVDDE